MFIIRLIDNGIGIEAGEIDRIFERYYQSKGKFYTFSSGIGLALCRRLSICIMVKLQWKANPAMAAYSASC